MSFCSFRFLFFFPIIFLLYYSIPKKFQWVLLLVSSYYFYMCWEPKFIVLILFSTLINYIVSRGIESATDRKRKKVWLLLSMCSNLSLLFFFKYFSFFSNNVNAFFRLISIPYSIPTLNVILPVGISFYTFQTMSYIIEVYRGNIKAEKHLGYFALFITYFPQLVAGPIERPQDLLPQLHKEHTFSYNDAVYGTKLMMWGFFKKLVVADTAALFVDTIYNHLSAETNGILIAITTMLFAFQIYCDFSGYSDIARGCARIMGVNLMVNFKAPYLSRSIKEYWTRHHISLNKWFTSYVYIPLGGNRRGVCKTYLNTTITFLLSGLWHGADWTFILWGGIQSIYLNIGDIICRMRHQEHIITIHNKYLQNLVAIMGTFCLTCFSWTFFRSNTIADVGIVFRNFVRDIVHLSTFLRNFKNIVVSGFAVDKKAYIVMLSSLIILLVFDVFNEKYDVIEKTGTLPKQIRWVGYIAFILFLMIAIPSSAGSTFIYFQF